MEEFKPRNVETRLRPTVVGGGGHACCLSFLSDLHRFPLVELEVVGGCEMRLSESWVASVCITGPPGGVVLVCVCVIASLGVCACVCKLSVLASQREGILFCLATRSRVRATSIFYFVKPRVDRAHSMLNIGTLPVCCP